MSLGYLAALRDVAARNAARVDTENAARGHGWRRERRLPLR
jgi:hypothetical protein